MKKQTQEQFLETIDRLLEKLAEREAEIAALRLAIRKMGDCDCGLTNSNNRKHIKTCNFMVAEQALSPPSSTSYLEQWEKENFEVVAWRDTGSYILDSYTRHKTNYVNSYDIVQTPLYARKEK